MYLCQLAVSIRSEQTQNNPAIQDKDQNMSTSIFNTQCNVCNIKFDKIENLNLHMKNTHYETAVIQLSSKKKPNYKSDLLVLKSVKSFSITQTT